ncbi:hypothetical protein [Helicobacter sp. MIT 14-3879]|uniref:hypothetical protein n=1 Tax=Helicobacter sp. MIT 14-3879 TaxID=2040649 RepID=UPI000E1E62A6|nr:hypothetical protein [Helicobacter sp. MIT 14-3879]RDU62651.1 hypothetical protein CQA44_06600 [Helicobacter sp. MIT 14-3879]
MNNLKEQELLDEIVTLLMASFSLAGVKDENLNKALEFYEIEINKRDDNEEYSYKSVCEVILDMKQKYKDLFY